VFRLSVLRSAEMFVILKRNWRNTFFLNTGVLMSP